MTLEKTDEGFSSRDVRLSTTPYPFAGGVLFLSVAALSPILAPPGHSHEICGTKKYASWARGVPSALCPKRYPTASTPNFQFQCVYLYPPWDSISDTQGLASITSQEAEEIPWLPYYEHPAFYKVSECPG